MAERLAYYADGDTSWRENVAEIGEDCGVRVEGFSQLQDAYEALRLKNASPEYVLSASFNGEGIKLLQQQMKLNRHVALVSGNPDYCVIARRSGIETIEKGDDDSILKFRVLFQYEEEK
ncbi:hypothetical protein HY947_03120 [Candidatus Gottesmanbacteria bacterium]|nr:hypothetical protein [Candidatus Gottesmanbacteria bacterium]